MRDWIEAGWNQRRDSAIEDFCAEDFSGQDARHGLLWGHDGIGRLMAQMLIAFPDLRVRIDDLVAEGDLVVLHVHTTRGDDTPGRAIVDIFRIDDGKVVEHWDVIQDVPAQPANSHGMF